MSPASLLKAARSLVAGQTAADGGAWARAAAFLARQALEMQVLQALTKHYAIRERPSFRSQLLAARAVLGPELAADAAYTWSALSEATHHHGYDLPPTASELEGWMTVIDRVIEGSTS